MWTIFVKSLFNLLQYFGEGNVTPLQWDGGAWWAAVCGVAWSRTRLKRLSSSSSSSRSYSLAVGCELLTAVAALVLEHRLSSCGAQT